MQLKKILIILMCMTMILGSFTVYAQDTEADDGSLEWLIAYGLENSTELISLQEELEKLSITLKDEKKAQDKAMDIDLPVGFAGGLDNQAQIGLVKKGYVVKATQQAYDNLIKTVDQMKQIIENAIIKSYTGVIQIEYQEHYLNKSIEKVKKLIKIAKLRLELNMGNDIELKMLTDQLNTLNNSLKQLEISKKEIINQLKDLINLPQESTIKFIDDFILDEQQDYDVERIIEQALKQRLDLQQKIDAEELQRLKVSVYDGYYSKNSSKYKLEEITLNTLERKVENQKESIKLEIENKIKELHRLREAYINTSEISKNAEQQYEIAQLKYELGIISALDLMDQEISTIDAYNKNRKALFDYINEKNEYNLLIIYGGSIKNEPVK